MKASWLLLAILLAACGGSASVASLSPAPRTPGPMADTWTRSGTAWTRHDATGPSARYFAALAYDVPRHDYVLFGGETAKGTSDETWTWDGNGWAEMEPAHKPPPRRNAAMAYDLPRHVVVLYGGLVPDKGEGRATADTWTWNGIDWSQVGPTEGAPGYREGARMVSTPDGVLLFGGRNFNGGYRGDALTWNGATWVVADGGRRPPGRANAAAAWDPVRRSLFVFGGSGFNAAGGPGAQGTPLADTWILARSEWVSAVPGGPPPLSFANAIWEPAAHRMLVLFGMECPNPTNATWAWDGVEWSKAAPAGVPARWGAAAAQDDTGDVLLFGGSDEPGC